MLSVAGKPAEAEAEFRKALAIYQKLADDNPAVTLFRRPWRAAKMDFGHVLCRGGQAVEAEAEFRTAMAIFQKLADDNPAVTDFREAWRSYSTEPRHPALADGQAGGGGGRAAASGGDPAEAGRRQPRRQPVRDAPRLCPHPPRRRGPLARPGGRGQGQLRTGNRSEGTAGPEDPTNTEHRYVLVCSMRRRGLALRDLGDPAGAAADIRRALALCDGLPPRSALDLFETSLLSRGARGPGRAGRIGRLGGRGGNRGRQGDGMAAPGGCHGLPERERTPDRVGPGPAPLGPTSSS